MPGMTGMIDNDMDYFNSKRRRVCVDDDDEEGLEEYFATYVPLSNLPTPPMSSASSPASVVDVSSGELGIECRCIRCLFVAEWED
jgi:hypothetical protein